MLGRENIKNKSVSFDVAVPLQKKLHDIAIAQKNYSEYVRTLMIADMLTDGALGDLSIVQRYNKKKYDPNDFKIEL